MADRKVLPEVEEIFDKYRQGLGRRLPRCTALDMFENEFQITRDEASVMFDIFDKDENEELSLWEFQHFHDCVGSNPKSIFAKFHRLERDGSGTVDIQDTFDSLKGMKTASGRNFLDKEIEMFLKSSAGSEKTIDIMKFINLMGRLKLYNG